MCKLDDRVGIDMSNKMKYERERLEGKKKYILTRVIVSLVIALLISCVYFNSNNVYKYQSAFYQASIAQCKGYTIDGSIYNYDEGSSKHYLEFSVPQINTRTFYMLLNKAPGDSLELEADVLCNGEVIDNIKSEIPGHEQYAKLYFENRKVDTIRLYIKGTFDFNNASIEGYQLNGDNNYLELLKRNSKIVFVAVFVLLSILFQFLSKKNNNLIDLKSRNLLNYIAKNKRTKKILKEGRFKFEHLFLVTGIVLSCLFITVLPNRLNISWDDQIHYQNVVTLSHYPNRYMSVSEYDYYLSCFVPQLRNSCDQNDASYNNILNDKIAKRTLFQNEQEVTYKSIVYLPMAIAMMILRGIGLKLSYVVIGTKLSGAIFYLYIIYRGMKHLSDGKMVVSVFALLPGTMFIISNFNYDYWLISLTSYSICYIIGEYQNNEKYLEKKDIVLIFGSFLLGIIVKVVYIPLLGITAFFKKFKFKNDKLFYLYRAFFVTVVVFAILGFLVLIFGGGLGAGDMRGGEGISTSGQIHYIISNPKEYSITLLRFLKEYWSVGGIKDYNVATSYMNRTNWYWWIVADFSVLVMLFDRSKNNSVKWYVAVSSLLFGFITSCMVATALYVTYTPVGSTYIVGCQSRYLLPILTVITLTFSRLYIPKISIKRRAVEYLTIIGDVILCGLMIVSLM